jgi:hypothetical protein
LLLLDLLLSDLLLLDVRRSDGPERAVPQAAMKSYANRHPRASAFQAGPGRRAVPRPTGAPATDPEKIRLPAAGLVV